MASISRAHERNDRHQNWEVGLADVGAHVIIIMYTRVYLQENVSRFEIQLVRLKGRCNVHCTAGLHACRHSQVEIPERVLGERRQRRPTPPVVCLRAPRLAQLRIALDEAGCELLPRQAYK